MNYFRDVRAEMKHVADRARTLGTASLEDFRYPEDRLKFIQDNLALDPQTVRINLAAPFAPRAVCRQPPDHPGTHRRTP